MVEVTAPRFRNRAGFGEQIEFYLIGEMLREGLDVYVPLVDDFGIDAVIRKADDTFIEVQIKARSLTAGQAATFAGITHELRPNYFFVFFSEILESCGIMSSEEFLAASSVNHGGVHAGKRTIKFHGRKDGRPVRKDKYEMYRAEDFRRFREVTRLVVEREKEEDEPEVEEA